MQQGIPIQGCDLLLTSDVPQGSGLSSSAALEVAIGGILVEMSNTTMSKEDIALVGQAAENNFIDCQCGIMDQLISAKATKNHAMLIDCRDLTTTPVPIPSDQVILVINSNYPRKLADSEYNERREACEFVATKLNKNSLRDATLDDLQAIKHDISDVHFKRAKHIITENNRVLECIDSLEKNDMPQFYELMRQGHMSLLNDFEIMVDATQGLVDICYEATSGQAGVRQTGGGFGGAVICVCNKNLAEQVKHAVETKYYKAFGLQPTMYTCEASAGLSSHKL